MYEPIEWSQGSENSDQDFGLKVSAVHMTTSIFTRELANKKTCAPIWPPGWGIGVTPTYHGCVDGVRFERDEGFRSECGSGTV